MIRSAYILVALLSVTAAATAATCDGRRLEDVKSDASGVVLMQAKPAGLSRYTPMDPGDLPGASLADVAVGDAVQCVFDQNVTISSHRFQNLQDNNGALNLHGGMLSWEQWTIADGGDGKVSIKSFEGRYLADVDGSPILVEAALAPATSWSLRKARHGKVHIVSHRGMYLGDWEGALSLNDKAGHWEEWFIAELDASPACASAQGSEQELAVVLRRLMDAQQMLFRAQQVISAGCGQTTPPPRPNVGRCAVFGDPHFITFDGGHTTFVGDQLIWVVRSEKVWMQAVSRDSTGNFMGLAIGGPFLQGHTLIVYNNSDGGPLRVTWDGERILQASVDEFHAAGVVDCWRAVSWNASLHDSEILELRTEGKFAVGPWPERFLGDPHGGLFLFRLPNFVEVTITGVDFMSAVITMPPQGKQSGYCGNYNGQDRDDFEPIVPSWNKPVGKGLGPVAESENLFRGSEILNLLGTQASVRRGARRTLRSMQEKQEKCPPALLAQAQQACVHVSDDRLHFDCIFDICATGNLDAARGSLAAEILELKVDTRGSVSFVGAGRCKDAQGHKYRAFQTEDVRTEAECQQLLQELAFTQGVVGAELMRTSTCQILVEADVDLSGSVVSGRWRPGGPVVEENVPGSGLVTSLAEDPAWSCWAAI